MHQILKVLSPKEREGEEEFNRKVYMYTLCEFQQKNLRIPKMYEVLMVLSVHIVNAGG